MKTCYKVVKVEDGKLVSCVADKKAQVEYQVGRWTKAPKWLRDNNKGPFVFETYEQAEKFAVSLVLNGFQVWECHYRCKIENFSYLSIIGLGNGELYTACTNSFPDGTIQVEQVKLIRRML